ncbi:hypothetical protein BC834DRAFT_972120 [Gloeopeniophorella convolvens]|nr:hypothetical protein BC834DRAFT_972120 [Gloeopeniophorella convolvens]
MLRLPAQLSPTHASPRTFTAIVLLLAALKLCGILWLRDAVLSPAASPRNYTYTGHDYPRALDLGPAPPRALLMSAEESTHYQLTGAQAEREWAALVPAEDGALRLGGTADAAERFGVSMLHELRCLDVLRRELVRTHPADGGDAPAPLPASGLARHCLNYVRQMALCRADTTLVSVLNPADPHPFADVAVCNDWERVYDAVARNQAEWRAGDGGAEARLA